MPFFFSPPEDFEGEEDSSDPQLWEYLLPFRCETRTLPIPAEPISIPIVPPDPYEAQRRAMPPPARKPSLFGRMFGPKAVPQPRPAIQPVDSKAVADYFRAKNEALSIEALNDISKNIPTCREHGIRQIVGHYEGGNDESFTHLDAIIMKDQSYVAGKNLQNFSIKGFNPDGWIWTAATAIMGRYDAGEGTIRGQLTIDIEAMQIIDSNDFNLVSEPLADPVRSLGP
jgi:hypothetical protein